MNPLQLLNRIGMCILTGLTVGGALMMPAALLNLALVGITSDRPGFLGKLLHPATFYAIGFLIGALIGFIRICAVLAKSRERHRPPPYGFRILVGSDEFSALIGAFIGAGTLGSLAFLVGHYGPVIADMNANGVSVIGGVLGFIGAVIGFFAGLWYGAGNFERERSRRRRKVPEVPGIDF
jgi:hypothetical protein